MRSSYLPKDVETKQHEGVQEPIKIKTINLLKEWNKLPDKLIEQETLESFKSALADYIYH